MRRVFRPSMAGLAVAVAVVVPLGRGPLPGVQRQAKAAPRTYSVLFALSATSGSLAPAGTANAFELRLGGVSPETTWFTDRPARLADTARTGAALQSVGFGDRGEAAPNGVLVIHNGTPRHDIVALQLQQPSYDETAGTLSFSASVLPRPDRGLAGFDRLVDRSVPPSFGSASLFLDDADVALAPLGRDTQAFERLQ